MIPNQYKAFQGSKKKGRKLAYQERKAKRLYRKNELSRFAEKMGMHEMAKKLIVEDR